MSEACKHVWDTYFTRGVHRAGTGIVGGLVPIDVSISICPKCGAVTHTEGSGDDEVFYCLPVPDVPFSEQDSETATKGGPLSAVERVEYESLKRLFMGPPPTESVNTPNVSQIIAAQVGLASADLQNGSSTHRELTWSQIEQFATEPTPEELETLASELGERVEKETLAEIYKNASGQEKA